MAGCQTAPLHPAAAQPSNSPWPCVHHPAWLWFPGPPASIPLPWGLQCKLQHAGHGAAPATPCQGGILTRPIAGRQFGSVAHLRGQRTGMRQQSIKSYRKQKGINYIFLFSFFFSFFFWKWHALPSIRGVQHSCTASSLASLQHAEVMSQGLNSKVILTQK